MLGGAAQTFVYSETSITLARQRLIALLLALVILVGGLVTTHPGSSGVVFGAIVFVVVPLGFVQHAWMERSLRHMRLQIGHDGIVRQSGAIRQRLAWSDITRIVLRHTPRGAVHAIELFAVAQHPMVVAGYEHMAEIGRLIETQVSPLVAIEMKRSRVNWENPPVVFAFALGYGTAVLAVLTTWDWNYQLLSGMCQLGLGLMFLLKQPLSRHNPKFRMLELILATGMIGLGLIGLVIVT